MKDGGTIKSIIKKKTSINLKSNEFMRREKNQRGQNFKNVDIQVSPITRTSKCVVFESLETIGEVSDSSQKGPRKSFKSEKTEKTITTKTHVSRSPDKGSPRNT